MRLIDDFIQHLRDKGQSENTIRAYVIAIEQFGPQELTGTTWQNIQEWIRTFSPESAPQKLAALAVFLKWAVKEGLAKTNPTDMVELPRKHKHVHTWLESYEIMQVRKGLENDPSWEGARDRAIFEVMLCTGIRNEALRSLRLKDVNMKGEWLKSTSKGRKEKIQPLNRRALDALSAWLFRRGQHEDDHLFLRKGGTWLSNTTDLYRIIVDRTSFLEKKITPHTLRHTHGQQLYDLTGDIETVRDSLDHSSIRTTQIYAKAQGERVRKAREMLG